MGMTKNLRKINKQFGAVTTLYHGEYGVGKTTLASQYPKAYFIMCENNNIYGDKLYMDNAGSWENCMSLIQEFREGNHDRLTLIIDNAAEFYSLAVAYFLEKFNSTLKSNEAPAISLTDARLGFGKGYDAVDILIKTALNPLDMHEKFNLVIIAHTETREIENLDGKFCKLCPLLPGKRARKYFFTIARDIYYYYYSKGKRYLNIVGNDFVMAKNSGNGHFKTTEGKNVINIPMGDSAENAFKYLQAAYNNQLKSTYDHIK